MSNTQSAPCPQCRAKNFTYRRVCWKCGKTLPTSFGLEGARAYNFAQPAADCTTQADIVSVSLVAENSKTVPAAAAAPTGRAEFRELVRGLLEKSGVY